jgi:transcriptional regulator NrdR family protein
MPMPKNMICPKCSNGSVYVIDSRPSKERTMIRRRRQCSNDECKARFTTYEVIAPSAKHIVILGEWEINANEMSKRHDGILG